MAGKGGGAWKVAYADFVTAMMAFFMVMWLTSQRTDVKEAVAQYFRDPFAVMSNDDPPAQGYGNHDKPQKPSGRFSANLERSRRGEGQPGRKRHGFAPIQVSDVPQITVLFPLDSAELTEDQVEHLKLSVGYLIGRRNRIDVRAHSLRQPLPEGSQYADHWELCYHRCRTVKRELEKLGIAPELVRLSQSEGNEPIAESLDRSELELNSRVDVHVLPEFVKSQEATELN